ncbi:MAG: BACON domain-containing protein [Alistipes sp.]|nr:BACON domain-containing protein [Alistipes sp.]
MKKLLLLLSLCAFVATSCSDSSDDNKPSAPTSKVILAKDSITVGSGNGMNAISYSIENPVNDLSVEATANVEWIHSFTYTDAKISFSTTANDLYEERVGIITVTYGESSANLTVTQTAKVAQNEIEETAPYLIGEYYGDYAGANYNYYVALSSSDYDASSPLYAPGWKYFLDIYASERPADYNNIRIPNGVYTLTDNGGVANSLFGKFSIYKEYDNSGSEIDEKVYEEATLTVTDDLVKLEVVFEDSNDKYTVTYSGDYTILDKRNAAGGVN